MLQMPAPFCFLWVCRSKTERYLGWRYKLLGPELLQRSTSGRKQRLCRASQWNPSLVRKSYELTHPAGKWLRSPQSSVCEWHLVTLCSCNVPQGSTFPHRRLLRPLPGEYSPGMPRLLCRSWRTRYVALLFAANLKSNHCKRFNKEKLGGHL